MFHSIKVFRLTVFVVLAVLCVEIGSAQTRPKNASKLAKAAKESQAAANTFTEIMNVPDKAIPQNLLEKAEAVAVFEMVKAGFIVGGRTGHGVISRRVPGGWSAPASYNQIARASRRRSVEEADVATVAK